jgi:tetratricopeptide (TPR) repeat protein
MRFKRHYVIIAVLVIMTAFAFNTFAETGEEMIQKEQQASKLFDEGDTLLIQKNFDEALLKYNEILTTYSNSMAAPVAMIRIGNIQRSHKQFTESIATFDKIAVKYPETSFGTQAMFNIANIYEETSEMQKAIDKYQEINDKYANSENKNITNVVAQAKSHRDNLQNSLNMIKEKIKLREERMNKLKTSKDIPPDQMEKMMMDNYINLADLCSMVNDHNESIKYLNQALQEYPNNTNKSAISDRLKRLK